MEDIKINYPVKYALLAMVEPSGVGLGKEYEVFGYVISKVYLMGMSTKYLCDGTCKIFYEVVFPYKTIDDLEKRHIPKFNLDGECYNYDKVLNIYDNLDDAVKMAEYYNNILKRNYVSSSVSLIEPNWKTKLINKQNDFDKRIKEYKVFEQVILEKTKDMIVVDDIFNFRKIRKK